jgi:hypothetical protein
VSKLLSSATSNYSEFCGDLAISCTAKTANSRSSGQKFSESFITSTPVSSLRSLITSYLLLESVNQCSLCLASKADPPLILLATLRLTATVVLLYFHRLWQIHRLDERKDASIRNDRLSLAVGKPVESAVCLVPFCGGVGGFLS